MNALCKVTKISKAALIREKYSAGSRVEVEPEYDDRGLARLDIRFFGPLSRIPSLKNSKAPGCNFMANDVRQRLGLMDRGYFQTGMQFTFGSAPVAMILVCGHRPNAFDKDNCVNTVQDWLEPRIKVVGKRKKRDRGWGVGVVDNDKQITSFAFYDHQLNQRLDHTSVTVLRWDLIQDSILQFAASSLIKGRA